MSFMNVYYNKSVDYRGTFDTIISHSWKLLGS